MPTKKIDATELTLSVRTVAALVMVLATTLLTGAGVYYVIQSKIDMLSNKMSILEQQNADQSRALLELTVTLKVKGVVGP